MKESLRRSIAYTVACQAAGRAPAAIYSQEDQRYHGFSGTPHAFHDTEQGCHISFQPPNTYYHHGLGNHFSIDVNEKDFSGYDHGEGHHFRGSIEGAAIAIYDHGEEKWYYYHY